MRLIDRIGLVDVEVRDRGDTDSDSLDAETIAAHDRIIDRVMERVGGRPDLQARGEEVRRRLHRVGIRGATELLAVGRKA